jgi:hypothetical protein
LCAMPTGTDRFIISVLGICQINILRLVKFAENEAGIILKFKHKTRHAKDRLYRKSH